MAKKISLKQFKASATDDGQGNTIAWVDPSTVEDHVKAGHIEVNMSAKDEQGRNAARLTATGHNAVNKTKATPENKLSNEAFEIVDGLPMPPKAARGGQKVELYPFSKLNVGGSFFIPATEKNPNPAKTFASTIGSAQRRFGTKTGETRTTAKGKVVPVIVATRKFTILPVTAGQKYENGFVEKANGGRVYRIA